VAVIGRGSKAWTPNAAGKLICPGDWSSIFRRLLLNFDEWRMGSLFSSNFLLISHLHWQFSPKFSLNHGVVPLDNGLTTRRFVSVRG
jgi:hypothetical protein